MSYLKVGVLLLCCLSVLLNASTLKSGVLMCKDADTVKKLVGLDKEGKMTDFLNYYDEMKRKGICSESVATMNPDNLGRQDLSGGVTKVGNLYFATQDIR